MFFQVEDRIEVGIVLQRIELSTLQHAHTGGRLRPTDLAVVTDSDFFRRSGLYDGERFVRSGGVKFKHSASADPYNVECAFHHATGHGTQRRSAAGRLHDLVNNFIDGRQRTRSVDCLSIIDRYRTTITTKQPRS